jgi:DNA modification methylase
VTYEIRQGDARKLDLDDESVDLIVTSPPYWKLRSYKDSGEHYAGQLGAEATPGEYIANLIDCTREWMRVLKPSGNMWVNLGDKYDVQRKCLRGLPWRYAIRCIDDLSLILRAEVVWSKPNGLPESCKDRVRRSHETWFHFTKSPQYFSAIDTLREAYEPSTQARAHLPRLTTAKYATPEGKSTGGATASRSYANNPLGKLPGSVWSIATQPLKVPAELAIDHYAAFPMEWPRRIISAWCSKGGTVLDPCGGTGTTALVADVLGRHGITVDLSADYGRIVEWRINDPKQRERARARTKTRLR